MADKKIIIKSPAGIVKWASLSRPSTQFNPDGVYEVSLLLDPEDPEVQAYIDTLEDHYSDYMKQQKEAGKKVYKQFSPEPDPDIGMYIMRYRQRVCDWMEGKNPIAFFDAGGKPIKVVPNIGSQSKLIVTAEVYLCTVSNKAYLSLRPKAVQVLELVLFEEQDKENPDSWGFSPCEGYEHGQEMEALYGEEEAEASDTGYGT